MKCLKILEGQRETFEFVCSGGSSFVGKFVEGLEEVKGLKIQINYHYVLHLNVAS